MTNSVIKPLLLIHGGAGNLTPSNARAPQSLTALREALRAGWTILERGGPAIEAVQTAVVCMEDSGMFSAGKGAAHDELGHATLDAAIMDGRTCEAGAIAAVPWVRNPIVGARWVMQHTRHVLMAGAGAEALLQAHGIVFETPEYFEPAHAAAAPRHGTVGAVALDSVGTTAAGTSTGGIAGKRAGRVGDSPLIGAGTYADEEVAVSATGQGEFFIRAVFAYRVAAQLEQGHTVEQAVQSALQTVARMGGQGGAIAVTAKGSWTMQMTSLGMFRGVVGAEVPAQVAIFHEELTS